jgi:hypothetical protein
MCSECESNLRNFHEFYQKIENLFVIPMRTEIKNEHNEIEVERITDSIENPVKVYEVLTIERLDRTEFESQYENHRDGLKNDDEEVQKCHENQSENFKNQEIEKKIPKNELKIAESYSKIDEIIQNFNLRNKNSKNLKNSTNLKNSKNSINLPKPLQRPSKIHQSEPKPSPQITSKSLDTPNQPLTNVSAFLVDFTAAATTFSNISTTCDICSEPLESFSSALEHFKTDHNQPGYVKCCNRKFAKRSNLIAHLDLHENPNKFTCNICGKKLTTKHNLSMHVTVQHGDIKPEFLCDHCSRRFSNKYRLASHMREHHMQHRSTSFTCQKCHKTFRTKARLENHITGHESTFCCEICGKNLTTRASLRDHIASAHGHPDTPRLKCHLCDHSLKNRLSLRKHLNRHEQMTTDIRCGVCNKPCTTMSALDSHMRLKHLLVRNIPCRHCEKMFKRPIDRDEHESTHTGVDRYRCEWCEAGFKFGANLRAHRKNAHPDEYSRNRPRWLRPE